MPVSEVMRHGVITVSPTDTVSHVMSLMTASRAPHARSARRQLVGIISIGDVVKLDWRIWSLRRTSYVMSTTPRVDARASAHGRARVSRCCSNLNDGQPAWLALHARAHLVMSAIGVRRAKTVLSSGASPTRQPLQRKQ